MSNGYYQKKNGSNEKKLGIMAFLFTSCIWGFAFVAQKSAMDHIGPLTMNGLRSLLGAIFLVPVILIADLIKGKKPSLLGVKGKAESKFLIKGGILCGIFMTAASTLQQIGVQNTTIGKAGFLSVLYIVIVPVITLCFGKKIGWNCWSGVGIALVGMFLLCFNLADLGDFSVNKGDLIVISCSIFFAIHILVIDKYSPYTDSLRLSFMQFVVCAVVCLTLAFIFENPQWDGIKAAWFSLFYAGVVSCGVGYTLQVVGQKYVPAHIAPMLMALECVFSLLADWIFFKQVMNAQEYIGCFLLFVAIILAQTDFSKFKKSVELDENADKGGEEKNG